MPAIYVCRQFAETGGLMSYGTDLADTYRQTAIYTSKILKGAKPADLPVQQAVKLCLSLISRPPRRSDWRYRWRSSLARTRWSNEARFHDRSVAGIRCAVSAGAGAAKQRRFAIVISTGPAASINDKGMRLWQAFFEELRRLGDVEGQNLAVERYSGKGRPERFADLAREVVSRNPDLIVAIGPLITLAVSAATSTVSIVATGTHPMVSP
jgi:ABC-type uncharacterized transport system substrate-binding protein